MLWDLNYRSEEHLGTGDKPVTHNPEAVGPIDIAPAIISILPELYNIPPPMPTEVFTKKIVNSHKSSV